jgi:hypothetical protein
LIDEGVDGTEIDGELVLEKLLDELHGDGSSSKLAGSTEAGGYFRAATRMPERKNEFVGGCLRSYKESMRVGFQATYDNCALRA